MARTTKVIQHKREGKTTVRTHNRKTGPNVKVKAGAGAEMKKVADKKATAAAPKTGAVKASPRPARFKKGSAEAKAHMNSIRAMRGKKTG